MIDKANCIKNFVMGVQSDCKEALLPPEEGLNASGQSVVPITLIKGTRKLFYHAIPLALGIVLSLISINYTTQAYENPEGTIGAIFFGIIGFPMVVASTISFAKKFSEKDL